jgi:hypothetical protein
MRFHLPVLLSLVSVAGYVACGSSEDKVQQRGASGEAGAGGEAGNATAGHAGEASEHGGAPGEAGSAGVGGAPPLESAGAGGIAGNGGIDAMGGAGGLGVAGASGGGGAGGEGGSSGPSVKIAFVSSVAYTGNLGGLDGADAKCAALASAANLSGTFRAWLSDSTGSPSTRFTKPTVDYVFVDGTTVFAHGWTDLISASPKPAFNVNELGGPAPTSDTPCAGLNGGYAAWVSSNADGTPAPQVAAGDHTCSNWSSEAVETSTVGLGSPIAANSWIGFCSSGVPSCSKHAPIFCFEQ